MKITREDLIRQIVDAVTEGQSMDDLVSYFWDGQFQWFSEEADLEKILEDAVDLCILSDEEADEIEKDGFA